MVQVSSNIIAVHQFIEAEALKNPQSIAVSFGGSSLSYQDLNEKANQLAHYLKSEGVTKNTLVGISVKRSLEMIVGILAVLKSGAAYVPIDPEYPKERMNFMIADSKISILITQKSVVKKLNHFNGLMINFDQDQQKIASYPKENVDSQIAPDNLAYVLYTSGSTGTPKGVMVTHKNLIHAYSNWKNIYELTEKDCHLQMASFSFDVFTGDLVRSLCIGGKLVICPRDVLLDPEKLYGLMLKEKVNCAEFVPTVLRKLIEYVESTNQFLQFMRLLICGSDNWSMNEFRKLQQLSDSKTRVINSYGLTEATIDSTYFEDKFSSNDNFSMEHAVPIGLPFPGTEIYLLDEKLNPVANGEVGEIYIGGEGVANGYLNQPELTQKKFIKHPFRDSETKLYKTGDKGRYTLNGNIEFLGRIDNQIKLRGMRIELSDIENVLNCHTSIRESLTVVSEDEKHHQRLIAYIVPEHGTMPDIHELRHFLQDRLPHYMIPSVFIKLDCLPTTPNGKLDRQALNSSVLMLPNREYVAPRNVIEAQLIPLWERLLGIEKIGIFDGFHDLGGDSLLVAKLKYEIEKIFSASIALCEMPKNLTISDLAEQIDRNKVTAATMVEYS